MQVEAILRTYRTHGEGIFVKKGCVVAREMAKHALSKMNRPGTVGAYI